MDTHLRNITLLRNSTKWFYTIPIKLLEKLNQMKFDLEYLDILLDDVLFTEGEDGFIYIKLKENTYPLVNHLPHLLKGDLSTFFEFKISNKIRKQFKLDFKDILPQIRIGDLEERYKVLSVKYPHFVTSDSASLELFRPAFNTLNPNSIFGPLTWEEFKRISQVQTKYLITLYNAEPASLIVNTITAPGLIRNKLFSGELIIPELKNLITTHANLSEFMKDASILSLDIIDFTKPNSFTPPIQISIDECIGPTYSRISNQFYNEAYLDSSEITTLYFNDSPSLLKTLIFMENVSEELFIENIPKPKISFQYNEEKEVVIPEPKIIYREKKVRVKEESFSTFWFILLSIIAIVFSLLFYIWNRNSRKPKNLIHSYQGINYID